MGKTKGLWLLYPGFRYWFDLVPTRQKRNYRLITIKEPLHWDTNQWVHGCSPLQVASKVCPRLIGLQKKMSSGEVKTETLVEILNETLISLKIRFLL